MFVSQVLFWEISSVRFGSLADIGKILQVCSKSIYKKANNGPIEDALKIVIRAVANIGFRSDANDGLQHTLLLFSRCTVMNFFGVEVMPASGKVFLTTP